MKVEGLRHDSEMSAMVIRSHRWQDCYPVVRNNTGKTTLSTDLNDDLNQQIRDLFNTFSELERRRFHEYCCRGQHTLDHLFTMLKIEVRLRAAGLLR